MTICRANACCPFSICFQFFGGHVMVFTGGAVSMETPLQSLCPQLSRGQQPFFNSSMSSLGMATDELMPGWGLRWVREKHTIAIGTGFNARGPLISIPNGNNGGVGEADALRWSGCIVWREAPGLRRPVLLGYCWEAGRLFTPRSCGRPDPAEPLAWCQPDVPTTPTDSHHPPGKKWSRVHWGRPLPVWRGDCGQTEPPPHLCWAYLQNLCNTLFHITGTHTQAPTQARALPTRRYPVPGGPP